MEFILLKTFSNYVEANIALSMLEEKGVRCHLENENTSSIMGMVSGIRLMVINSQLARAEDVLKEAEEEYLNSITCPLCHHSGLEIKYVTESHEDAVRKMPLGRFIVFMSKLFSKEGTTHEVKHYICKNCHKEFEDLPA